MESIAEAATVWQGQGRRNDTLNYRARQSCLASARLRHLELELRERDSPHGAQAWCGP
jgi:hypothetical protein